MERRQLNLIDLLKKCDYNSEKVAASPLIQKEIIDRLSTENREEIQNLSQKIHYNGFHISFQK